MDFIKKLFGKKQEFTIPSMAPVNPPESHSHQFEVIMKAYAAPRANVEGTSPEVFQKALFGVTTLLSKCVVCSASRQEEVLGTDEQPLDQLFEKVSQYGPQYIQKEGVTFIIAKYQPPAQSTNLPLR